MAATIIVALVLLGLIAYFVNRKKKAKKGTESAPAEKTSESTTEETTGDTVTFPTEWIWQKLML